MSIIREVPVSYRFNLSKTEFKNKMLEYLDAHKLTLSDLSKYSLLGFEANLKEFDKLEEYAQHITENYVILNVDTFSPILNEMLVPSFSDDGCGYALVPVPWSVLINDFKLIDTSKKHTTPQQTKQTKDKIMSIKDKAAVAMNVNKSAGLEAARLKVGKTANNMAVKIIKPKLPLAVRGLSDHPLFKVLIANLTMVAVQQMASGNSKAVAISGAMITSSYIELLDQFDIDGMIEELTSKFTGDAVDKLTDSVEINLDD